MEIKERRHAPRFNVSLDALAKTKENHFCPIKVFNISSSGLQFSVAQHEIPKLLPNTKHESSLAHISIELDLKLKIETLSKQPVSKMKCGIVYIQRKSQLECNVGCRFEEFFDNSNVQLEKYIKSQASQSSE
ncbi:MAG: PilZ domain-containing protein [Gammaproteobacteria bacterium]|nr:PilZ domain-containing protein [Gammaproteobacteria bacterium]